MAYAELNDFASAVKWQISAIELLSDERQKEDYRFRLKLYQEEKPYRAMGPRRKPDARPGIEIGGHPVS